MKLIFIYGPFGVGKLTVAEELSHLTGIKLIHNHLSSDFAEQVFPRDTKAFEVLRDEIRRIIFDEAAKANINLIATGVVGKQQGTYIPYITNLIEKHGGEICFVQLYCDIHELQNRVIQESRKEFKKIQSKDLLMEIISQDDFFSPITYRSSLKIDNTNKKPEVVAKEIIEYYKLPNIKQGYFEQS